MSDSVANVEMEDVLTSIRRLVSDKVRAREAAPSPDQSLLLCDTQRIAGGEDFGFTPAEATLNASTQLDALTTLEATIAELEAAVSGTDGFEPEVGGEKDLVEQTPAFFRSTKSSVHPASANPGEVPANLTFIPTSVSAPVEDAPKKADPMPLQLLPENKIETVVQEPEKNAVPMAQDESNEDDEEILLDEETLRQMVQTIVREELQGSLGDAITRNIRRLIRREIHAYFDVKDAP